MDVTTLQGLLPVDPALAGSIEPAYSPPQSMEMGYGGSLTSDIAAYGESLAQAEKAQSSMQVSAVPALIMEPLSAIDREARALGEFATDAMASGSTLSPGEIVSLTMHSQEFLFHSQLTANVANRTADGLQQLFRQQG